MIGDRTDPERERLAYQPDQHRSPPKRIDVAAFNREKFAAWMAFERAHAGDPRGVHAPILHGFEPQGDE